MGWSELEGSALYRGGSNLLHGLSDLLQVALNYSEAGVQGTRVFPYRSHV